MLSGLMNLLRACFRPRSDQYVHTNSDTGGRQDGLLWYKDHGQHVNGEFSMAVVQANNLLEDQSQLESGSLSFHESGPHGTFVGVYDGHGGPETSRYINDHLFQHLKSKLMNSSACIFDFVFPGFCLSLLYLLRIPR
jgi:pyruvate dehydrogenase phosphatase